MSRIHLTVTKKTAEMIREQCKKIFLDHHPEFKEVQIPDNKILFELARYYIETETS